MIPPAEEGESKRATRMRSFIAEVRGQALNDVLPSDEGRVFYAKPWWQRVIVMFAGPFNNLVLAVLFFTIVLVGFGRPETTTTISAVPGCVIPAGAESATAEDPCRCRSPRDGGALRGGDGRLRAARAEPRGEGRPASRATRSSPSTASR